MLRNGDLSTIGVRPRGNATAKVGSATTAPCAQLDGAKHPKNSRSMSPNGWAICPSVNDTPLLRYVGGYRVSEVAATMNCGYKATESLLARARRNARALVSVEAE